MSVDVGYRISEVSKTRFTGVLSSGRLFRLGQVRCGCSAIDIGRFTRLLQRGFTRPLPLASFSKGGLFCLPGLTRVSAGNVGRLLSIPIDKRGFNLSTVARRVCTAFRVRDVHSAHDDVHCVLSNCTPHSRRRTHVCNVGHKLRFVTGHRGEVARRGLRCLCRVDAKSCLPSRSQLLPGRFCQRNRIFVINNRRPEPKLPTRQLPNTVGYLISFTGTGSNVGRLRGTTVLRFTFTCCRPCFSKGKHATQLFRL